MTVGPPDDPLAAKEAFVGHLAGVDLPAHRDRAIAEAREVGAPTWVLDLLANLDDQAPFATAEEMWTQASGPDGS